jgi:hypothetical protein
LLRRATSENQSSSESIRFPPCHSERAHRGRRGLPSPSSLATRRRRNWPATRSKERRQVLSSQIAELERSETGRLNSLQLNQFKTERSTPCLHTRTRDASRVVYRMVSEVRRFHNDCVRVTRLLNRRASRTVRTSHQEREGGQDARTMRPKGPVLRGWNARA